MIFIKYIFRKEKEKNQHIKKLEEKIKALEDNLSKFKSIETAEKNIDKSHGTIYYEKFPDGKSREICGYCWEKEHIKIPIISRLEYNETLHQSEYWAKCQNCGHNCTYYNQLSYDD